MITQTATRSVAMWFFLLVLAIASAARAELVPAHLSFTGGSTATFRATLDTDGIFLDSPGEGAGAFQLSPDETVYIQLTGQEVSDMKLVFAPPPQFSLIIEGERQMGYSSHSLSASPFNHLLAVTLVRRETPSHASIPLGQAGSIGWHPPKTLGLMGPYIDFNVGNALNGQPLPPLRIPLYPRATTSDPLALDFPDCAYTPDSGGFQLVAPQVIVRLDVDTTNPGRFELSFYTRGAETIFARYQFQFPIWPGDWRSSRQAKVINDSNASGSAANYETTITGYWASNGMTYAVPYNTWTIEDWHLQSQPVLRTVLVRRDSLNLQGGGFGEWYVASTISDTAEVRRTPVDPNVLKNTYVYNVFNRWLTEYVEGGIQVAIAEQQVTEGVGDGNYLRTTTQNPRAPDVIGSKSTDGYCQLTDAGPYGKTVYETWLDNSPTIPSTAYSGAEISANGGSKTVVNYDVDPRWIDFQLPTSAVKTVEVALGGTRTITNSTIAHEEQIDTRGTLAGDDDLAVIVSTRRDFMSGDASDFVETVTKRYRPDVTSAPLRGRIYSIQTPDGGKLSFHYELVGSDVRVTIVSGATTGGDEVTGLSSTMPIDPLHMIAYRSTKIVEVYQQGHLMRRETFVYVSGSGNSPVFNSPTDPITWEAFEYTNDGRLKRRTTSANAAYEALWVGSRKAWEKDETGLTTSFEYDDRDRVTAATREAAGGVPALRTEFEYDAADRVRYVMVGPGDTRGNVTGAIATGKLVTENRYDLGGRIKKRIVPGGETDGTATATGIVTDYNYANGDRDVTEIYADGAKAITRYADGRVKGIGGSAVMTAEAYDYGFDSGGRQQFTLNFSTDANTRPRTVIVDRLGHIVEQRVNGVLQTDNTSKPIVTTTQYGARGLVEKVRVAEINGSQALPLSADRVFDYDEFGAIRSAGLDLNRSDLDPDTAGLQTNSTDRFSSIETRFHQDTSGTWWLRSTGKTYYTNNTGSYHATERYARLSGLAGGRIAQVDAYDYYNNRTSQSNAFDPTAKTRVLTVLRSDGTKAVTTSIDGLVTSVQVVNDAASETQTTSYAYDAYGRLVKVSDPRSIALRYEYHPGTSQIWKTYEGRNEADREVTTATLAYDSSGRVTAATDANGSIVATTYYPTGQVRDRAGNGIHPVHYEYDAYGQLKELWTYRNGAGGSADKTIWTYEPNTGWLREKRDAANRSVSYTYSYASPYKIVTRSSPRNISTTYKYRLDTGELAAVDYSDGTPDLAFSYTRNGQIDTVTEGTITNSAVSPATFAAGARIRDFTYDREQLSSEALDSAWYGGLVVTTLFDDAPAQTTTSNLVPGRYAGFALGYASVVNGVPQPQQLAAEMKVAMAYDDFGRPNSFVVSHANSVSASFGYEYAPNTSFWNRLYNGAYSLRRVPEPKRDAIKSVTAGWNATTFAEQIYTSNDAMQRAGVVQRGTIFADYGNDGGATSTVYGYNSSGELTSATGFFGAVTFDPANGYAVSGASQPLPGRDFSFGYDTAGNRRTAGIGAEQVDYNDGAGNGGANNLNQVKERGTLKTHISGTAHPNADVTVPGANLSRIAGTRYWDAVLDSWGQFRQVNLSAARNGQIENANVWALVRPAQESFVYDEEGNLTDDALWHYEYDAENRLTRMATRSSGDLAALGWTSMPPEREITFQYDYLGRRIEKVARKNGAVTFNRRFVYEGWNLLAEFELVNGAAKLRRSYAWGLDIASSLTASGGVGALLLETVHNGSSRTYYNIASDGQGSVTALIGGNGTAVSAYEYDPFGQLLRAEGQVNGDDPATLAQPDQPGDNPFRYSSKYLDRETGLYYYGRRYYDPSLGRFLNRDPLGEEGGGNLYAFVSNSPVNGWDYLGLEDNAPPIIPPLGPTPETPGEDGSYQQKRQIDIRESAVPPSVTFGTNSPNKSSFWDGILDWRNLPASDSPFDASTLGDFVDRYETSKVIWKRREETFGRGKALLLYATGIGEISEAIAGFSVGEERLLSTGERIVVGTVGTFQVVAIVAPVAKAAGSIRIVASGDGALRLASREAGALFPNVGRLPDDAIVVRGGIANIAENIATGSGVIVSTDGKISGLSVQSASGKSLDALADRRVVPNNQIGVTTVGAIRAAGGDVMITPGRGFHAEVHGVTPEQMASLFKIEKNPNPKLSR